MKFKIMRKIYEIGKELGITEEEIKEILYKATNDKQKIKSQWTHTKAEDTEQ